MSMCVYYTAADDAGGGKSYGIFSYSTSTEILRVTAISTAVTSVFCVIPAFLPPQAGYVFPGVCLLVCLLAHRNY